MTRRTFRVAAVLVAVFALLASSCFAIRGSGMTKKVLGPGEQTMLRVNMMPYNSTLATNTKVFILVGWVNADRVARAQFDTLGNWGGPYQGKRSVSLANQLLLPGACQNHGMDASELTGLDHWEAWHTPATVDATGPTLADLARQLRATIKMQRPAGTGHGQVADVFVFSGAWDDANDNDIFDAGDEAYCTGLAFFTIPFAGS